MEQFRLVQALFDVFCHRSSVGSLPIPVIALIHRLSFGEHTTTARRLPARISQRRRNWFDPAVFTHGQSPNLGRLAPLPMRSSFGENHDSMSRGSVINHPLH